VIFVSFANPSSVISIGATQFVGRIGVPVSAMRTHHVHAHLGLQMLLPRSVRPDAVVFNNPVCVGFKGRMRYRAYKDQFHRPLSCKPGIQVPTPVNGTNAIPDLLAEVARTTHPDHHFRANHEYVSKRALKRTE